MQVFLPYKSIIQSARVLDNKRLNKQILEAEDLIFAMYENNDKFYKNHPARKMWEGYAFALWQYRNAMLAEKIFRMGDKRNYSSLTRFSKNIGREKILSLWDFCDEVSLHKHSDKFPDWFYNDEIIEKLCKSHRKALLIKDFNHYSKHFSDDIDDLVLNGYNLTGYDKVLKAGKNKGQIKHISAKEAKSEYIRDNKIYYWANI